MSSNPLARISSPQPLSIFALDLAVHSSIGATVAATTVTLNPVVGAVFGAVYFFASHTVSYLIQSNENKIGGDFASQTTFAKMMKFALAFFAGIALATAACTFLGMPIVFSAGSALTAAMFATTATIATFVFSQAAKDVTMGQNLFSSLCSGFQRA